MSPEGTPLPRAVVAVLAVLFCLAMVISSNWADMRERGIIGPSAVKAGPEGQVFVVSHGSLWVLDRQGNLSASLPIDTLGIHGRVCDVLPLRGGEILIAERGPGLVHRCRLAERVCVPFTTDARFSGLEGSFELAADDDQSQIYLAHTTRHAVHLFDGSGTWLATSDAEGQYRFPHRPVVVADELYVADTNHRRLVAIERDPTRFGELAGSFSTETFLGSPGRVYPIAHRRLPGGTWWVVIGDARLQYSDIVVFDAQGKPIRRLDLPADASPVALEVLDDRVLAADPVNLQVAAFSFSGDSAGEFGDRAFRGELAHVRNLKRMYKWLRYGSWAALTVPLLALVAVRLGAIPRTRRRGWLWLVTSALLAVTSLSLLGTVALGTMGALYEDMVVLVVGSCVVLVAVPTLVIAVLLAWRKAPRGGRTQPSRGR